MKPIPDPWVTVVVLAYRQGPYVEACLRSLETCGLEGVEVMLVDNASQDGTAELFQAWAGRHPGTRLLLNKRNLGHTRAFNQALAWVAAPYVLDLAADDELLPGGLQARVRALTAAPEAAFCHANAELVDARGRRLRLEHPDGQADPTWSGDVFQRLFEGHFISPPTVLFRTQALREAGGYDEALSYEDFDAWIRLARAYPVAYVPDVVCRRRLHGGSASSAQVRRRNQTSLESTLIICQKAIQLSQTQAEREAIGRFARYHLRLAAYTGNPIWVNRYATWLEESGLEAGSATLWRMVSRLPLGNLYAFYTRWRLAR